MSQIIKSSAAATTVVQSFGIANSQLDSSESKPESRLEARLAELEAELAARDEAFPDQLEEARAEGAQRALEERSDAEERALQELKSALALARDEWEARLASIETVATGLTRAVLVKVFSEADSQFEQVASSLKQRLQLLEASSIIRARVSSDDFSSERVSALSKELGSTIEIEADVKLESGRCVIDLKLGHVEVSPGAQWQRISELLDRIEHESETT